jgi:HTH-type transcriptional regulator, glycine betaine synthesis regulator
MSTTTATQLTAFEAKSVELFVDAAGVLGVPRSIAMIYGVLFGSAHALSFNDIVEKLGISKGSVSQGLRVLREMGAVQVDTRAESSHAGPGGGGAGSHYRPVIELRILLSRIIADKVQPHLKASAGAIDDLKGLLPEAEAESEVLDNRLRHLRSWQKRSQDLLPLLKAFLR